MTNRRSDLVVGVPYGNQGKKKWVKIGAVIQIEKNDPARGPGIVVMLDKHINLAGLPTAENSDNSVAASTFWPKQDEPRRTVPPRGGDGPWDDDIPF